MNINLTPDSTSNAVRVGLGLTLRTSTGVAVRGYVTHADYDRQAALEDGTVGILRRKVPPCMDPTIYWLEV